jgi:hypothetical protein
MKKLLYLATLVSIMGSQQVHAVKMKLKIEPAELQSRIDNPKYYLYISKSKDSRSSFICAVEDHGRTMDEIQVNFEEDGKTVTFNRNTARRDDKGFLVQQKRGREPRQIQNPDFYRTMRFLTSIWLSGKNNIDFQVYPLDGELLIDDQYRNIMRFYTEASPVVSEAYDENDCEQVTPVYTETIEQPTLKDLREAWNDLQKLREKLGPEEFKKLIKEIQEQ